MCVSPTGSNAADTLTSLGVPVGILPQLTQRLPLPKLPVWTLTVTCCNIKMTLIVQFTSGDISFTNLFGHRKLVLNIVFSVSLLHLRSPSLQKQFLFSRLKSKFRKERYWKSYYLNCPNFARSKKDLDSLSNISEYYQSILLPTIKRYYHYRAVQEI